MKLFLLGILIIVGGMVVALLGMWALMHLMEWLHFNIFYTDKEDR